MEQHYVSQRAQAPLTSSVTPSLFLPHARRLLEHGINANQPREALIQVLEAVQDLVSLPDNDFSWSAWEDSGEALVEIELLIQYLRQGWVPAQAKVAVLFAPTGPLQELSLSSGWAEAFLKVAEKYDEVEAVLWPRKSVIERLRGWLVGEL